MKKINLVGSLLYVFAFSAAAQTSVSVKPLGELVSYPERFAPATVISLNEPWLSAQITAQITAVPVRVGDMIKAGNILVQLDCREYELGRQSAEAGLESAQARYEQAKTNLERSKSLVGNQLISKESLDSSLAIFQSISAEVKASQAKLDLNRLYESRCQVKAPFDALVLERSASVGQLVTAGFTGTALIRILDLSSLEVSAQIFAGDADQFRPDLPLELDANNNTYALQLKNLVAAMDSATRNREARLVFTGAMALPGSSGKLRWNDPRPHLPANYLIERGGQLGFFVVKQNKAEFQVIAAAQPGRINPVDLPLDTLVVTEGYAGLSQGDSLLVNKAQ